MALSADRSAWQRERAWLGYAGLLPFLICSALLLFSADPELAALASASLRNYAAVIASFLAAVHWGVAADVGDRLAHARMRWGIMPALLAWTLLLIPAPAALFGFAVLFGLILIVDRYLLPLLDEPYRQLRLRLSVVVIVTLFVAATATAGASP